MSTTHYWTGSNNSTFLRNRRKASSLRAATIEAKEFPRGELRGEGRVTIYAGPDNDLPVLTIERTIRTGYRTIRTDDKGNSRTISL